MQFMHLETNPTDNNRDDCEVSIWTIHRRLFGACCVPTSILRAVVTAVKCTGVDPEFMALPSRLYLAEKGANKKLK